MEGHELRSPARQLSPRERHVIEGHHALHHACLDGRAQLVEQRLD